MSWYKKAYFNKSSGVSFWIDGSEKIAKPMDIVDISNDLAQFCFSSQNLKSMGVNYWNSISPDTPPSENSEGYNVINFYLRNPKIKEMIPQIIDGYNIMRSGDIVLRLLTINRSRLLKNLEVARIDVIKNSTPEIEPIPDLHISNDNAAALLSLLNNEGESLKMDVSDLSGSLDAFSLKQSIGNIEQNSFIMGTYTKPYQDILTEDEFSQNELSSGETQNRAKFIDMGRTEDQMMRYLSVLKEMINYIERHNLPSKKINFG